MPSEQVAAIAVSESFTRPLWADATILAKTEQIRFSACKEYVQIMNAGQLQSLKDLIEFLKQQEVGEFELEQEGLKVRLNFAGQAGSTGHVDLGQLSHLLRQQSAPVAGAASTTAPLTQLPHAGAGAQAAPTLAVEGEESGLHIIKSPIVGTFYEASAPGAEPYIKIGDQIDSGQVVCIVEAMKLMNEIESDIAGEVVKRMVTSGQPVEYGQPLFSIRPR